MAELLVRVTDRTSPDIYNDVKLTKRGDVIVAAPDGWGWSVIEKTNPEWRIFRWPALSMSEAQSLLAPELPTVQTPPNAPDPMLQRRGFYVNVDILTLPKSLRDYVADNTRAAWGYDVPANVSLTDLKTQRPKRVNPNVIG